MSQNSKQKQKYEARLKDTTFRLLSKHFGQTLHHSEFSLESLVVRLGKQPEMKGVSNQKIRTAIQSLGEEGSIRIERRKGGDIVKLPTNTKVGTFFRINSRQGGYVVDLETKTEIPVAPEVCKDFVGGSVVSYTVRDGSAVVQSVQPPTGKTNAGVPVDQTRVMCGLLRVNEQTNEVEFWHLTRRGYVREPITVLHTPNSQTVREAKGQIVTVRTNAHDTTKSCQVEKIVGPVGSYGAMVRAIAEEAGIAMERDEAVAEEANRQIAVDYSRFNFINEDGQLINQDGEVIDWSHFDPTKPIVVDKRDDVIIEFDTFGAQDHDDASSVKIDKDGNFVLYNYISLVSWSSNPKDCPKTFEDVVRRMFSFYFAGGSVGMHHEALSADKYSLMPGQERMARVQKMVIDRRTGKCIPEKSEFFNAVVKVDTYLTYDKAQEIYDTMTEDYIQEVIARVRSRATELKLGECRTVEEVMVAFMIVGDLLKDDRHSRGAIRLEGSEETRPILNDRDVDKATRVVELRPVVHLSSMDYVESAMIAGNEAFAHYMLKKGIPGMYRVHGEPSEAKAEKLMAFADQLGINYDGDVSFAGFQRFIKEVKGKPYESAALHVLKTCLDRARYSAVPCPTYAEGEDEQERDWLLHHFGLGLTSESETEAVGYSHSTSPIRRGPDDVTQENSEPDIQIDMCKKYLPPHLRDEAIAYWESKKYMFSEDYMYEFAHVASQKEREVDAASELTYMVAEAMYYEEHINDVVEGVVRFIDDDMITIQTKENVKVRIPISDFVEAQPNFAPVHTALITKQGEVILSLGATVRAKISGADRVEGRVYGSTDLTKTYENPYQYDFDHPERIIETVRNRVVDRTSLAIKKKVDEGFFQANAHKQEKRERRAYEMRYDHGDGYGTQSHKGKGRGRGRGRGGKTIDELD
ncbi:MAG: RNB domain-containing ribonuclease [Clostridia bacterium]|nr:RNB domain-containing ribonuclease [Clostridia bacterium]